MNDPKSHWTPEDERTLNNELPPRTPSPHSMSSEKLLPLLNDWPDEFKNFAPIRDAVHDLVEQYESMAQAYREQRGMREAAEMRLAESAEQFEFLLSLAEHLFQMIDRETWRDTGGDDGQGHYEGDYRAEEIEQRLRALRASFPAGSPKDVRRYEGPELTEITSEWTPLELFVPDALAPASEPKP